jgi:hypothetical protein
MFRILKPTKDTYITNRIINNKFRAIDANVGQAGTLDLFKLYDESSIASGTSVDSLHYGTQSGSRPIELSRLLIKFDLDPLHKLTGSTLNIGSPTFNCTLKLFDVYGGQPTPSNFKVVLHPLSQAFDEGIGRDIFHYADVDSCNFLTASVLNSSASLWYMSGANASGLLGSRDIDIISSGNLYTDDPAKIIQLWKQQTFNKGDEDLSMDVTQILSATLVGLIPDHGFRLSFSGSRWPGESEETDNKSRFVKRFASRHSVNTRIRPRLEVRINDTLQDNTKNFEFDVSGTIFFNNYSRGQLSYILSGTSATEIKGSDCITARLVSGSFSKLITGSQYSVGSNFITGVYSASFAISSFEDSTLRSHIINAGSASFNVYWGSISDGLQQAAVGYLTSSLMVKSPTRTAFGQSLSVYQPIITNAKSFYLSDEKVRLRLFIRDQSEIIKHRKLPREVASKILNKVHYRIVDMYSGDIIIPFDETYNATLLSTDSYGNYFDIYMDSLDVGRVYQVDLKLIDSGMTQVFENITNFRVDPATS